MNIQFDRLLKYPPLNNSFRWFKEGGGGISNNNSKTGREERGGCTKTYSLGDPVHDLLLEILRFSRSTRPHLGGWGPSSDLLKFDQQMHSFGLKIRPLPKHPPCSPPLINFPRAREGEGGMLLLILRRGRGERDISSAGTVFCMDFILHLYLFVIFPLTLISRCL